MNMNELQERIIEMEREISSLPAGSMTTKKVKKMTCAVLHLFKSGHRIFWLR